MDEKCRPVGISRRERLPERFSGIYSANVMDAVTVEKANPEKPFNSRKKAVKEFNGVINYEKLTRGSGVVGDPRNSCRG